MTDDPAARRDRPRLLDLFCGAGGAAMGYHRAGFDVVGVDHVVQPHYPFLYRRRTLWGSWSRVDWSTQTAFQAIHASPPCQAFSDLAKRNGNGHEWPDLITPLRPLLAAAGLPSVIENVEGAPLIDPIVLCGTMFLELRVIRHRLFECSFPVLPPPHGQHPLVFTYDKRKAHYGQLDQDTAFVSVNGGGNCSVANKRAAMGVPWMTGAEANEAIPPAYTKFIGARLREHLEASRATR